MHCKIHGKLNKKDIRITYLKEGYLHVWCIPCRQLRRGIVKPRTRRTPIRDDIKKHCDVHGELVPEQIAYCARPAGKIQKVCRKCVKIKTALYQPRLRQLDSTVGYKKKQVAKLAPAYVKDRLVQAGFKREAVTSELIETKTVLLKLARKIRSASKNVIKEKA